MLQAGKLSSSLLPDVAKHNCQDEIVHPTLSRTGAWSVCSSVCCFPVCVCVFVWCLFVCFQEKSREGLWYWDPKVHLAYPSSHSFNMFCLDAVKGPGTDLTCHNDNWHIQVVAGVPEEDSSKSQILHAESKHCGHGQPSCELKKVIEHSMTNSDHINQNPRLDQRTWALKGAAVHARLSADRPQFTQAVHLLSLSLSPSFSCLACQSNIIKPLWKHVTMCNSSVGDSWQPTMSMSRNTLNDPCRLSWSLGDFCIVGHEGDLATKWNQIWSDWSIEIQNEWFKEGHVTWLSRTEAEPQASFFEPGPW